MASRYVPRIIINVIITIIIVSVVIESIAFTLLIRPTQIAGGFVGLPLSSSYLSPQPSLLVHQVADHSNRSLGELSSTSNTESVITIVTLDSNGTLLPGAIYSVSSYPVVRSSNNVTIRDDGPQDSNTATKGIISISGLRRGDYLVTELKAPAGHMIDKVSKLVQIGSSNQSPASAAFTNTALNQLQQKNNTQIKSITYSAKFECGSIIGNEGPLRPGHYDTDISIFNRQDYPINILLNVAASAGAEGTNNAIIKTLSPQTSTAIVCKDLRQFLGMVNENSSSELIEGFVIIRLDVNGGIIGSLSSSAGGTAITSTPVTTEDINNFLDVQVFYTANALDFLPHEILVKDIAFSILSDNSSKIPKSLLMKPLDIVVQSGMNEISDSESKIRDILAGIYKLTGNEASGLRIKISNMSVGLGTMIDDHAISSSTVKPQAVS